MAYGASTPRAVLTVRSRAMRVRESGQVRKEAALSGAGQVPRNSLTRASHGGHARRPFSRTSPHGHFSPLSAQALVMRDRVAAAGARVDLGEVLAGLEVLLDPPGAARFRLRDADLHRDVVVEAKQADLLAALAGVGLGGDLALGAIGAQLRDLDLRLLAPSPSAAGATAAKAIAAVSARVVSPALICSYLRILRPVPPDSSSS